MNVKKLTIAIISDLHCQHSGCSKIETYLVSDHPRTIIDHPVESILDLIKKEKLRTELTLCPGDFTNKSDKQGFHSGWGFALEIHQELGSSEIIATIGNHDVDSYGINSNNPFQMAKGIKRGFPINDDLKRDTFWSKGGVFIENEVYRVLVINSSHFQYNKESASIGQIDVDFLRYIKEYLNENKDNKISIAMAHHHPIDHSRLDLGVEDKIVNADELMEILGFFKFDLFIHGHKHDPLIRNYPCRDTTHVIPVLSSGSFSATSNISFTGQRNSFHKLDLVKGENQNAKGTITTWTFMPKNGWKIVKDQAGFPAYTGFGYYGNLNDVLQKIKTVVGNSNSKKWSEVVDEIPEVSYLLPNQALELEELLKAEYFVLNSRISEKPEYISNVKST